MMDFPNSFYRVLEGDMFFFSFVGHGCCLLASIYCLPLVALELSGLVGHFRGHLRGNHVIWIWSDMSARPSKDSRFHSLMDISEPDGFF